MICQQMYGAEHTAASAINAQILTHCRDIVKNTGPPPAFLQLSLHAGAGQARHDLTDLPELTAVPAWTYMAVEAMAALRRPRRPCAQGRYVDSFM